MALAIDASTPAYVSTNTASSLASGTFSPPAGSLLVLLIANGNDGTLTTSVTDNLAGHLTYTKQITKSLTGDCSAEVWTAPCPSAQTNMTVTVGFAATEAIYLGVLVFSGAAITQAGATGSGGSATAATITASVASMSLSSWLVGAIANGTNGTGPTIPGGQTDIFNALTFEGSNGTFNAGWAQANGAAGNSNLTINDTAPSVSFSEVLYEVQGSVPPPVFYPTANVNRRMKARAL